MKKVFFLTVLGIVALTALMTLAGIAGFLKIQEGYLNKLLTVIIVGLGSAMVALFRSTKFFEDSLYQNLDGYQPSQDAARILHTLLKHQEQHDDTMKNAFGMRVLPGAGDFPRYLNGLAELVGLGLVNVDPLTSVSSLTSIGYDTAKRLRAQIQKTEPFVV
jgi:hypothetical protein